MQTRLLWFGGALALCGVALWRAQPAPLRSVGLVAVQSGNPARARLALKYGAGTRPSSVILDVAGPQGAGSATVAGDETLVEVPISGAVEPGCRITATAGYRVLGRLRERTDVFGQT